MEKFEPDPKSQAAQAMRMVRDFLESSVAPLMPEDTTFTLVGNSPTLKPNRFLISNASSSLPAIATLVHEDTANPDKQHFLAIVETAINEAMSATILAGEKIDANDLAIAIARAILEPHACDPITTH